MGFWTLAIAACSQIKDSTSNTPTVCAKHVGCVIGKLMPGYQTDYFEAFMGIPYAMPPIGELRFSVGIDFKMRVLMKALQTGVDIVCNG